MKKENNLEKEFRHHPMDGDRQIEVGLEHRTLISVKNASGETIISICVVGSKGNRSDCVNVDLSPGVDNAIDVYHNDPKADVHLLSIPKAEYDAEIQSRSSRHKRNI
jgi:hypothetical protein